jgi:hypothetical protein
MKIYDRNSIKPFLKKTGNQQKNHSPFNQTNPQLPSRQVQAKKINLSENYDTEKKTGQIH